MATISSLGVGSGLDLNGLLDQLESAEREKLEPIQAQRSSFQAKLSAYGSLEGALGQFQDAAASLNDAGTFNAVKSSVAGDAVTAAAGSDAATGQYSIDVSSLASRYSVATAGVADREADLGAGTIGFELASGETFSVSVDAGDSSLESIRDAINAADGGVSASIVNDGSGTPYRLALASTETGTDAAIANVDFGALAGSLTLDAGTEVAAENAALKVNGIDIVSQTNQVEGAIEGVTLSLASQGAATLNVEADTGSMRDAVTDFVDAYNTLQGAMSKLTRYDAETGEAGQLLGDSTLRSVETQLRREMSGMQEGGELTMLSDLGISLQLDGTLDLDEGRLDELVTGDRAALQEFFAGSAAGGGFAGQLDAALERFTRDGGTLDVARSGIDTSLESLSQREARMETSIDRTIERYREQFSQLDSMISSMNQTSDYLTQQFDSMNAQLNQGRR